MIRQRMNISTWVADVVEIFFSSLVKVCLRKKSLLVKPVWWRCHHRLLLLFQVMSLSWNTRHDEQVSCFNSNPFRLRESLGIKLFARELLVNLVVISWFTRSLMLLRCDRIKSTALRDDDSWRLIDQPVPCWSLDTSTSLAQWPDRTELIPASLWVSSDS